MKHAWLPACLIVLLLLPALPFTAYAQAPEPAQPAPATPAAPAAQAPAAAQPSTVKPEGVYFVAYRTRHHIERSTPEVFHKVADELIGYLKSREVNIIEDPERGILQTDEVFSTESLLNLSKNAGATCLLLATVDRSMAKWLNVIMQAYDLSGNLLWTEEASSGSGFSGGGAPGKVLKTLTEKLDPRMGGPGLPRRAPLPPAPPPAAVPAPPPAQKPSGTEPLPRKAPGSHP